MFGCAKRNPCAAGETEFERGSGDEGIFGCGKNGDIVRKRDEGDRMRADGGEKAGGSGQAFDCARRRRQNPNRSKSITRDRAQGNRGKIRCANQNTASVCKLFEPFDDEIEGDEIVAAFGYDDVGISFRRLDEFQMHRPDGFVILLSDGIKVAAAFAHIAADAAKDADIGVGIDENFDIEHIAQRFETEEQNAFDDDDGDGIDVDGIVEQTRMGFEVVERHIDGQAAFEAFEMFDEQFAFETCGVVEIDFFAFFKREIGEIAIIPIELNEGACGAETFADFSRQSRFSGARSSRNADDFRYHNCLSFQ